MYFQFVRITSKRLIRFINFSTPKYVFRCRNLSVNTVFVTVWRNRYFVVLSSTQFTYYYRFIISSTPTQTYIKYALKKLIRYDL